MGGKKKKPEKPRWAKIYKQVSAMPPADISPFLSSVSKRFSQYESDVQKQLSQLEAEKQKGLQFALTSAIGTTEYNPFANLIKQSISKIGQEKIQPFKETQQKIATQYASITPDVSKTLRLAGAYQKAKQLEERMPTGISNFIGISKFLTKQKVKEYRDIAQQFQPAWESSQKFLSETESMLKNLGLADAEIKEAMSPYYRLIEQGMSLI